MTNPRSRKKLLLTTLSILSILGYGFFVFAAPPGTGGYNPGETLDPECTPGQLTPNPCIVKSPLVTANNGLTATGSNVQLGGTLLQNTTIDQDGNDFSLIKNPETQLYSGSSTPGMGFSGIGFSHFETDITSFIGLMQDIVPVIGLFANTPDGELSRVLTMGEPSGIELINQLGNDSSQLNLYRGVTRLFHRNNSTNTFAGINIYSKNGQNATDFSIEFETEAGSYVFPRTDGTANQVLTTNGSGQLSWTTPSGGGSGWSLTGNSGTTAGTNFIGTTDAQDFIVKTNGNQIALFKNNSNIEDKMFTLGSENQMNFWKDGSFAYNNDNFQNDNPGTEQNMFYFNYGNHDGLGGAQTKRAIRLGSASNDEWDINSGNVGDRSVAIGFADSWNSTIAKGLNSIALGYDAYAEGDNSVALGQYSCSIGYGSFSWGTGCGGNNGAQGNSSIALGDNSGAIGYHGIGIGYDAESLGVESIAFGTRTRAYSDQEIVIGFGNTSYTPTASNGTWSPNTDPSDRLFVIGNGNGTPSDALTILKSGQTGIAIDNFEANTNGNIFQIGDGTTGIIAYVDSGTGAWVPVSDERKKQNITDLSYNIDTLMQLRPVSFDYKRNGEHTIGFLAQQVQGIVPEAVFGDDIKGYGMAYDRLVPVTVKAIQEMNLNITQLSDMSRANTWRDALIAWFANTTNGITDLFTKRIHTDELCVGTVCVTQDQFLQMVNNSGTVVSGNSSPTTPDPDIITDTNPDEESAGTDFNAGDNLNTSTDSDNTITE